MKRLNSDFNDNSHNEEINISPLIDVVFILLIFFIVTMAFSDKRSLEVDVPESANAQMPKGEFVSVVISQKSEIIVDDSLCSLSTLSARIKASGKKNILVYSDKSVRADKLVEVIDNIKSAGDVSIYLATQQQ